MWGKLEIAPKITKRLIYYIVCSLCSICFKQLQKKAHCSNINHFKTCKFLKHKYYNLQKALLRLFNGVLWSAFNPPFWIFKLYKSSTNRLILMKIHDSCIVVMSTILREKGTKKYLFAILSVKDRIVQNVTMLFCCIYLKMTSIFTPVNRSPAWLLKGKEGLDFVVQYFGYQ